MWNSIPQLYEALRASWILDSPVLICEHREMGKKQQLLCSLEMHDGLLVEYSSASGLKQCNADELSNEHSQEFRWLFKYKVLRWAKQDNYLVKKIIQPCIAVCTHITTCSLDSYQSQVIYSLQGKPNLSICLISLLASLAISAFGMLKLLAQCMVDKWQQWDTKMQILMQVKCRAGWCRCWQIREIVVGFIYPCWKDNNRLDMLEAHHRKSGSSEKSETIWRLCFITHQWDVCWFSMPATLRLISSLWLLWSAAHRT